MRIYLHIGVHKTGTSAVQLALRDNAALLAEEGVLYPASGRPDDAFSTGHHLLAWTMVRPELTLGSDPWGQLRAELSQAAAEVAVLSSEEFDVVHREEHFARLRAELRGYDVKLVVYLRRQDEVLHTMYSTNVVEHGETRPFGVFRRSFRTELDYGLLLRRWEEWLGRENLLVRVYEPGRLVGGNVVPDFLDCVGLSGLPISAEGSQLVNRSFPRNILNLILSLREGGVDEDRIREVVGLAQAVYPGRTASDIMPPAERRAIMSRYRVSNAYVARTYFGREDGKLFDDIDYGDDSAWDARYAAPCADLVATLGDVHRRLAELGALG